jgi:hypothetical protein
MSKGITNNKFIYTLLQKKEIKFNFAGKAIR